MAYWGMAMANVNNAKRAKGFLKVARRRPRPPRSSRRESLYLDALAALYKDGGDDKARRQGLAPGPGEDRPGVPRRPRRPRLAGDGHLAERPARTGSAADRRSTSCSKSVLDKNPLHPGAHHYTIHLWDGSSPTQALEWPPRCSPRPPRDRPRLAHARPHLHRAETLRRRRLPAGRLGPGRSRLDDRATASCRSRSTTTPTTTSGSPRASSHVGRARDAIAVARNLVEQPRDPEEERPERRRLRPASRPAALDRGPRPLRALGRPDRRDRLRRPRLVRQARRADRRSRTPSASPTPPRGTREKLAEQVKILTAMLAEETKKAKGKAPTSGPLVAALSELEGHQKYARGEALAALESFTKAAG